jgi:hypothetical protein
MNNRAGEGGLEAAHHSRDRCLFIIAGDENGRAQQVHCAPKT